MRRLVVRYVLQLIFEVIVFQIYCWPYTVRIEMPSCQWKNWSYTNYEKSVFMIVYLKLFVSSRQRYLRLGLGIETTPDPFLRVSISRFSRLVSVVITAYCPETTNIAEKRLSKTSVIQQVFFDVFAGTKQPNKIGKMPEIQTKFNLEVMTTIFWTISAKFINLKSRVSVSNFKSRVSDLLMKSRSRRLQTGLNPFSLLTEQAMQVWTVMQVSRTVKQHLFMVVSCLPHDEKAVPGRCYLLSNAIGCGGSGVQRGERTGRRHRASKARGHPKSEFTKIKML